MVVGVQHVRSDTPNVIRDYTLFHKLPAGLRSRTCAPRGSGCAASHPAPGCVRWHDPDRTV